MFSPSVVALFSLMLVLILANFVPIVRTEANSNTSTTTEAKSIIEQTLELLAEGDSLIELSSSKDIILVVGNTGAGKSTLVQFLAGDNSQLVAQKKGRLYLIQDARGKISTKTTVSKSIFPELVVAERNEMSMAFYDCPGFADTRSQEPHIEIGNAFFIKKVADHGQRIKLLVVANHFSLQSDADRNDFVNLLKSLTVLVKDVSKFRNGVALIASKVRGYEQDEEMIADIAGFLQDVKAELPEVLTDANLNASTQLLDAFLFQKNDDDESREWLRLGVFRAPTAPGPLSAQPRMQANKHDLLSIIDDLEYVPKSSADFGYVLSPVAQLLIHDLVSQIERNTTATIEVLCGSVFESLKQEFQATLQESKYNEVQFLYETRLATIEPQNSTLGTSRLQDLMGDLVARIRVLMSPTLLQQHKNSLVLLRNQGVYLTFFETARGTLLEIDTDRWTFAEAGIKTGLDQFLGAGGEFSRKLQQQLLVHLASYVSTVTQSYLKDILSKLDLDLPGRVQKINQDLADLQKLRNSLSQLGQDGEKASLVSTVSHFVNWFRIFDDNAGLTLTNPSLVTVHQLISVQLFLDSSTPENVDNVEATSRARAVDTFSSLRFRLVGLLDDVMRTWRQEKGWLHFLQDVLTELSEPPVQIDDEHSFKAVDLEIIRSNVSSFWTTFSKLGGGGILSRYEADISPLLNKSPERVDTLLNLLRKTLKTSQSCQLRDGLVKVEGVYLVLSTALQCFKRVQEQSETVTSMTLVLLASHTVFLDSDVNGTELRPASTDSAEAGSINLVIIAPVWKITASRPLIFNLNGKNGYDGWVYGHTRTQATSYSGSSGTPGGPGGNGGHFFGIAGNVLGPGTVQVTAEGGNGGAGQHGQQGANGNGGRNAQLIGIDYDGERWLYQATADCWRGKQRRLINRGMTGHSDYFTSLYGHEHVRKHNGDTDIWRLKGEKGTRGYQGGNGGPGGGGGNGGWVQLITIGSDYTRILFTPGIQRQGVDGDHGPGGYGGYDGRQGTAVRLRLHPQYCVGCGEARCRYWVEDWNESAQSPGTGPRGADGGTQLYRQQKPEPSSADQFSSSVASHINTYKTYARTALENPFLRTKVMDFLVKVDDTTGDLYDIFGLVNEFVDLEQANTPTNVELLPFFESLKARVETFIQKESESNNNSSTLHAHLILYGAVLSSVCGIKAPLESYLVTDMTQYLQLTRNTATKYSTALSNQERLAIVQAQKTAYQSQVDGKIAEAQDLVEQLIKPEFGRIQQQMEAKTEELVQEIVELKQAKVVETHQLLKKKFELMNQMKMNAIFGVLQLGASILGFVGPIGAGAGALISGTTGIAQQLTSTGSTTAQKLVPTPDSVLRTAQSVSSEHEKLAQTKMARYQTQTQDIQQLLLAGSGSADSDPELEPVTNKITEIEGEITKLTAGTTDSDPDQFGVHGLMSLASADVVTTNGKEELKFLLVDAQKKLSVQQNRTERVTKVLGHLQKATNIVSIGVDMYAKHRESQDELDAITEQIEQSQKEEEQIEAHKAKVYEVLTPLLANIRGSVDEFQYTLPNRSRISLHVGKWQMSQLLRQLRNSISQEFMTGFRVDEDLKRCFENLEEATTVLIGVFDRLQTYGEQQELVNVMTAIGSASFGDAAFSDDTKLKSLMLELQVTTSRRLLLQDYDTALSSFKLWVFPFGKLYLDDLVQIPPTAPNASTFSVGVATTAAVVAFNIETLSRKLAIYKSSIVGYDQILHHRHFDGRTTGSFYVWPHEAYGDQIARLLSGHKIALKAHVSSSPTGMDAIKFRRIQLNFQLRDDALTHNRSLSEELSKFKVQLIHSGNSEYRDTGSSSPPRLVNIVSKRITFSYSYSSNSTGTSLERNAAYEKLGGGDIMLSPYTLWEIQLLPLLVTTSDATAGLEPFADSRLYKFDLQLNGDGTYVQAGN